MTATAQITKRYYETTAGRGHTFTKEHYERSSDGLYLRMRPWLPKDRTAVCLDVACGCGEFLYMLRKRGFTHLHGVDLSTDEIAAAKQFVDAEYAVEDVVEFIGRQKEASRDLITAFNFLEHLSKDQLVTFLEGARNALRPGGTLVALVPNALSPFGSLTRYWDFTHEWAFTPNNFHQLAALTGFSKRIDFRECAPVPHGLVSGIRYLLWQVIRAGIASWCLVEVGTTYGGTYSMNMMVRLHR